MRNLCVLSILFAIACSEIRQEEPSVNLDVVRFHSGTRLKVVVRRTGSAEVPYGIYDSQLDTPCYVADLGDGTRRCIPSGAGVAYRDPLCSHPLAVYSIDECRDVAPRFATITEPAPDACTPPVTHVFAVGEPLATPTMIYEKVGTECQTVPTYPSTRTSALGGELSANEMAEIKSLEVQRGDALSVTYDTSADGYRALAYSIEDRVRHVSCHPTSSGRCVPDGPVIDTAYFTNATCSGEGGMVLSVPSSCAGARVGVRYADDVCDPDRYFEVGPPSEAWVTDGSGACVETAPSELMYAPPGREIPLTELPAIQEVDQGTSPIRVRVYEAAGAPLVGYGDFIDDAGVACYGIAIEGGVLRCVPSDAVFVHDGAGQVYADAACSERVALAQEMGCDGAPTPLPRYVYTDLPSDGRCLTAHRLFELGEEHVGFQYMRDGTGTCVSIGQPAQRAFRVGAPVPEDRFTTIEEIILE